jgi:hypothetical protein
LAHQTQFNLHCRFGLLNGPALPLHPNSESLDASALGVTCDRRSTCRLLELHLMSETAFNQALVATSIAAGTSSNSPTHSSPESFEVEDDLNPIASPHWQSLQGQTSPGSATSASRAAAPLQKRRRVTRACDECRRKKIKCDGKQPCTHCTVYSYGMASLLSLSPGTLANALEIVPTINPRIEEEIPPRNTLRH